MERIEELEKENEKKGKTLIAKMRKREELKEKFDNQKKEKQQAEIEAREEKMKRCNNY